MTRVTSVLRNTGYVALGETAKPVLSFVLILLISRMLGRDGVGVYAIVLTFSGVFELVATAGLGPLIIRGVAADRSKLSTYVSGSIGVALLATLVLVPAILLVLRALHYPQEVEHGIRLLTYTLVLAIVQQHVLSACEGLQVMALRTVISVMDIAGRLAIGVFMVVGGHGIFGVIQGMVIMRVITVALALWGLRTHAGLRLDARAMLRTAPGLIRLGAPFLLMTLASTGFWSANILMLSKLNPVEDVGVYNAAVRISEILKNIFYSYLIVLLPMMAQAFATSLDDLRRECETSLKYLLILAVPAATGVSVLAGPIIRMVYGHSFDAAVPVLQVLAWTVCVFCVVLVFARVLVASHHQVLDLYCNVAALAINVGLGWVLIRARGPVGAGVATLVSLLAFGALEYAMVTRRLFRPAFAAPLIRAGVAALAMAAVVHWLDSLPLALRIGIGAVTYLLVLSAIGTFSRDETAFARDLAARCVGRLPLAIRRAASAILPAEVP